MNHLKVIIWGFAFGVANIIPGVSGGTFALVLGFYERLLHDIERLNSKSIKSLIQIIKSRSMVDFKSWAQEHDLYFLIKLGVGAILSIASLSSLMKYLLNYQFGPTYSFFFGLILLSVLVPWKLIRQKSFGVFISLILACILTVGVSVGVDPVKKAEKKSEFYQTKFQDQNVASESLKVKSQAFQWTQKYSLAEYLMVIISGCLAVSAMVLPGISGSLLLILMGQYMIVIQAIANLKAFVIDDFVFLSTMSIGMVVGLFVTARLVKWALNKHHDLTMGALTGLILGSLFVLWPFREVVLRNLYLKEDGVILLKNQVEIHTNQVYWPDWNMNSLLCWAMMILGVFVMMFFLKNDPETKS